MENFETSVNTEEVADLSQPEEVTSEVTEPTEERTEVETVEEPAKPQQTAEENSRYAEARRQAEAEARAIRAQNERLLSALNQFGYEGTPEEVADALMAQTQNITVEEAREQRETQERENEQLLKAQSEAEFYRNIAIEKLKADDLSKIKTAYPDAQIKSLDELGEEFYKTLTVTQDPVLAYDIINAKKQRETKPIPQDIGAVNSSSSKEKDFYTPAEVDKLSKKELSNPKIMQRVMDSMSNWK